MYPLDNRAYGARSAALHTSENMPVKARVAKGCGMGKCTTCCTVHTSSYRGLIRHHA